MSGALVAQAINESIGTAGFQGLDAILKEYLGLIAEQAGTARVPISRTINGHSLASDVDLKNDDVGAAPAGFGLGTRCKIIDTWNTELMNGWYASAGDSPDGEMWAGFAVNDPHTGFMVQRVWKMQGHFIHAIECTRYYVNGVYGEWEWVNPPMIVGVEYHTTERWQGMPVYVKLVDCGALPNSTTKYVLVENDCKVLRCTALCESYNDSIGLPFITHDKEISCHPQSSNIVLYSNYNTSSYKAYVTARYVKV